MDIIFENKTTITKEILTEFAQKGYKIYDKKYRIFVLIAAIVAIITGIIGLFFSNAYFPSIFLLVCSCFFFFIFFKGYMFRNSQNYKDLKALYGEQPQFTFTFFADNFESASINSNLKVNYSQITNMIETNDLYILMMGKQGLMLNKSGFTIGDSTTFNSFIWEKCENVHYF